MATDAEEQPCAQGEVIDCVAPVWLANAQSLPRIIEGIFTAHQCSSQVTIDPFRWDHGEYSPTPTIVEAARILYQGQNVSEITRCHAGAENLTRTSSAIMRAIEQARREERKLICFVTGVPGSGKTLAGLNIVHNRGLHEGSIGVFLSGNGPLVKVLTEALARDNSARTTSAIAESRRQVSTFIQNVHRFIDAHYTSTSPPPDRVVVFDEAQRAWNRDQSLRKFNRNASEPEIMLSIMNRHRGYAVIVALVGAGQEINTGEAGLREWGRALADQFRDWTVFVSPFGVANAAGEDTDSLFPTRPDGICICNDDALHLDVSLRSYKAQAVSDFVEHVLSLKAEKARSMLSSCDGFSIVMTRDLHKARSWLKSRQRGSRRIGLVASSSGRRLRAYGLDVRAELDVENWFLNSQNDVRSSFYLETPATEFGIQGLELDWTGVCWEIDLVPNVRNWCTRAFRGTHWHTIRNAATSRYLLNKYRVLLTRAREGMIVWVPKG